MRVWGKTKLPQSAAASVARRALEGISRAGLVREAVMAVLESGQADRAGVWVESEQEASWAAHKRFSGFVAEPAVAASPSEWFTLSVEAPLPVEVISGLQGVEQELLPGAGKPLIGALTEMRQALWIPVETRGRLRGVVFAGQRSKTAKLPWQAARSVAAELGLALELEDQRRRNDAHRASNDAVRSVLETLDSGKPASVALQEIVTECTREGPGGGAALAVFAAIGRAVPLRHDGESAHRALDHDLEFLWRSGEHGWTGALAEEPLQSLWRSAIETRRVVGTELRQRLGQEEVGRIVVIPLQARGEALGVFIGGIRERSSSLAALESMELRAALAADILLRERIEEAQRTRELRERALLGASRAAAVDVDEHGRMLDTGIIETLNSGKTTFDSSTASKEGQPAFTELFAADCAAAVGDWLQESQAHRTSDIFEEATLRTGHHVRLRLLPTSEYGKRTVLLERLDSTGQHNERSALAELRNVIEWVDEGVVLFGANHEIRAINSRFAQIMGLAPEELERIQNFGNLLDVLSARLSNAGSLGQRWPGLGGGTEGTAREELRIERPVPRLVERVAHPILDENGVLLGRVEIFRDLTTHRLFQSKLVQNGKLAELGQKLTAIAHELSNPLTSILGYAQRLLRRGEPRNDFREARQIFQEAERASAILRQLLLSVRESRPERRRVALNQLISRAADLNSHDLANDNVHFQLDLDPSLPLVKGDEGQLQQVLQNLIGNARQALASQGEGATIRLTTRRIPDHRVLLEVTDNGPGIPVSIQSRIFDPFFTTKPAGEGTGLGLSIVAGIVSEHGGQVRVKSAPGRGSVFSVELPATTALEIQRPKPGGRDRSREGSLAAAEPAAPGYSGVALSRWAGARVLVLEDEPTVARLIADVLEDEGLKVDTLLDSREALSRTARLDYAFVICDMKMPQLDGEEFYLALLREGSPLCARFLFVTGDVLSARTRNFLERYELPYVAKPFRVEELTDKIRSVLERGKPFETGGDPLRKNAASK